MASRISISNAAGPRSKELSDIRKLFLTNIDAVTIGSITLNPSAGNAQKFYWYDKSSGATLNSLGLSNRGLAYYQMHIPELLCQARLLGKKVRVSIAGSGPQEYATLARAMCALDVDEIEINASCPNVWHGAKQQHMPSFDPELLRAIITQAAKAAPGQKFDIKLSPLSDPRLLSQIATTLDPKHVRAVVASNTFPNAFVPQGSLSGLGGNPMRYIALGQVRQLRRLLPRQIKVIGVGGISKREHVHAYVEAGANSVQVGSYYFEYGPGIFKKIMR